MKTHKIRLFSRNGSGTVRYLGGNSRLPNNYKRFAPGQLVDDTKFAHEFSSGHLPEALNTAKLTYGALWWVEAVSVDQCPEFKPKPQSETIKFVPAPVPTPPWAQQPAEETNFRVVSFRPNQVGARVHWVSQISRSPGGRIIGITCDYDKNKATPVHIAQYKQLFEYLGRCPFVNRESIGLHPAPRLSHFVCATRVLEQLNKPSPARIALDAARTERRRIQRRKFVDSRRADMHRLVDSLLDSHAAAVEVSDEKYIATRSLFNEARRAVLDKIRASQ